MPATVWKPHVTVAAVIKQDNRYLLVRERIDGKEVWNQPAGHLDADESLVDAVIRETLEETSYRFTPQGLIGVYRYQPQSGQEHQRTYLRFCFSGNVSEKLDQPLDTDIISAEWLSLDQIQHNQAQHRSPMVLQCILDSIDKPSYPLQLFSPDFL